LRQTPASGTFGAVLRLTIAVLMYAASARAEDTTPPPDTASEPVNSPAASLEAARRLYAQGRTAEARERLRAVLALGPALGPEVRQQALAYLGDITFSEEGARAAEPFFRALLDENPRYTMDPLDHQPEVSRFVESLRPAKRPLELPRLLPAPPAKPPWLSLAPGGVVYFARGKVATGFAVAGTQAALLVANAVLIQQISAIAAVDVRDPEAVASYQRLELASNLTAGAFYLSLVLPPAVEFSRWSSGEAGAAVLVGPGTVQVAGRF